MIKIITGDCRDVLRGMADESVQCVVTSPPYWGLRDYGVESSVWDDDPACEHEWGAPVRTAWANKIAGEANGRGGKNVDYRNTTKETGPFCCKCGAWNGVFGLEPDYRMYVAHAVEIFREVRRVLRRDGTLWLNLGDSYATGAGAVGDHPGGGEQGRKWAGRPKLGATAWAGHGVAHPHRQRNDAKGRGTPTRADGNGRDYEYFGPATQPNRMPQHGLKPKDLCGIPWRVAFALQDDGWWLRQDVVWAKPNPMPESVTDRCTKSHEYLFLLTKSADLALKWRHRDTREWALSEPEPDWIWRHKKTREESREPMDGDDWTRLNLWRGFDYHFDQDAILEPISLGTHLRVSQSTLDQQYGSDRVPGKTNGPMMKPVLRARKSAPAGEGVKNNESFDAAMVAPGRPKRSGNVQRKAASERGVPDGTGKNQAGSVPWEGFERNKRSVWTVTTLPFKEAHFATFPPTLIEPCILAGCPEGGVVLDPFGGAGTTALVADRLNRDAVVIELNPKYADMARRRISGDAPLFTKVAAE